MKYLLTIIGGCLLFITLLILLPKKSNASDRVYGVKLRFYSLWIDGAFCLIGMGTLLYLILLFDNFNLAVVPLILAFILYIPTYYYCISPYKYLWLKNICYSDTVCNSLLVQLGYTAYKVRIIKGGRLYLCSERYFTRM